MLGRLKNFENRAVDARRRRYIATHRTCENRMRGRAPASLRLRYDPHELAAISLAREFNADLLLIDENKGRQAAIALHIRTARTAAVLFDAANAGAIADLKVAFEKLKATNFRVPLKVLDELLKRHQQIKAQQTGTPKP